MSDELTKKRIFTIIQKMEAEIAQTNEKKGVFFFLYYTWK